MNHLDNKDQRNARVAVSDIAEAMMNELSDALQTLSQRKNRGEV